MVNKVWLQRNALELLKAYAGSGNAEPEKFEEAVKDICSALRALVEETRKG